MKYFKKEEFDCKCGCGGNKMSEDFLNRLDKARGEAGIPFNITSGYRCESHNKKIGGVTASAHTKGVAADIKATDNRARYKILVALLEVGFTRLGVYSSFIHVDMDATRAPMVIWRG